MCVLRNIEARSCQHRCISKAVSITYSECVCSLRYPAWNAHAPYCYLCPLRLHKIFSHYLIKGFSRKKVTKHKLWVDFFPSYQLNAQSLYSITIYMLHYNPQHVSSSTLLIFRRTNCIITASGIITLCKQPYSMPIESGLQSALNWHRDSLILLDVMKVDFTTHFILSR